MILKQLRALKSISQQKLADTIGVSRTTVTMWEIGATEPNNEILKKLAIYFEVSVDVILGIEGDVLPNGRFTDWPDKLMHDYRSAGKEQRLQMFVSEGVPRALAEEYWKLRFPGKQQEPAAVSSGGPGNNLVRIASRDGTYLTRSLTDEQILALKAIIDQFPEATDL